MHGNASREGELGRAATSAYVLNGGCVQLKEAIDDSLRHLSLCAPGKQQSRSLSELFGSATAQRVEQAVVAMQAKTNLLQSSGTY